MNKNDYCIIEYSYSQDSFHIDFIDVSIDRNRKHCLNKQPSDWTTVGIFDTWEKGQNYIETLKKQLHPNNKTTKD